MMPSPQPSAPRAGNGTSPAPPPAFASRPSLPDRNVTAANIEDAYVRFIFYCNPALPLTADTETLREAFRNPPRSGGKAFNTFAVYELVVKFYGKDIKTWTELTTKLGVERPDPSKDESAQKIAQYGVRLKKWMNSLHVKSFFEYLMDIPNDYWKQLPVSSDPISDPVRDGVAVEDDMALRALLPHIRPKRGRKRPDGDDVGHSPAQRQRLSPSSAVDDHRQEAPGPWSAQTEFHVPFPLDAPRPNNPPWGPSDAVQTPLIKWPHSAITPTTRGAFWEEPPEPRSAITPSKPKLASQRRGAKNVSSAWKPGGPDSSAKTRGRPPINRTPVEAPNFSHPSWTSTPTQDGDAAGSATPMAAPSTSQSSHHSGSPPQPPVLGRTTSAPVVGVARQQSFPQDGRPARPSISLQVPERQGGSVRLATPPPVVVVSGEEQENQEAEANGTEQARGWDGVAKEATDAYEATNKIKGDDFSAADVKDGRFENMENRTNVDALMGFLIQATYDGDWVDAQGRPAERASTEECTAIVDVTIQGLARRATSVQAFLLNLAALAGAQVLMTRRCRCTRLGEDADGYSYSFNWEYGFGAFRGAFSMAQHVPRSMWTRPPPEEDGEGDSGGGEDGVSAAEWERKYRALKGEMAKRDRELLELRGKVVASLKKDARES